MKTQLQTPSGAKAKSQYVHDRYNGQVFTSYGTEIAMVRDGHVYLTDYWDFSSTTLKYLKQFLDMRLSKQCIHQKLNSGEFTLVESLCSI